MCYFKAGLLPEWNLPSLYVVRWTDQLNTTWAIKLQTIQPTNTRIKTFNHLGMVFNKGL